MRSGLFWDIERSRLVGRYRVSGHLFGPICTGQVVQEEKEEEEEEIPAIGVDISG